jgi:uncharacterized membrane protein
MGVLTMSRPMARWRNIFFAGLVVTVPIVASV